MITIDGSFGEGGGQILRTSLGLSLYTGKPFQITNIRGKRKKPGLLRQHLTAVKAAQQISNAEVTGLSMGSQELSFNPGPVQHGHYHFPISTAGSGTLVLQAILPALITGKGESEILFEGGTHNPYAPPFTFLKETYFNLLNQMGAQIHSELLTYGFYPAGGGKFRVKIKAVPTLKKMDFTERGKILSITTDCLASKIPMRIPQEEANIIRQKLNLKEKDCKAREVNSPGPGNAAMISIKTKILSMIVTGLGAKNIPLKKVARQAIKQAEVYKAANIFADEHLADQLLIPMAIAGGGTFTTSPPSPHTQTNIHTITKFLSTNFSVEELSNKIFKISIREENHEMGEK